MSTGNAFENAQKKSARPIRPVPTYGHTFGVARLPRPLAASSAAKVGRWSSGNRTPGFHANSCGCAGLIASASPRRCQRSR